MPGAAGFPWALQINGTESSWKNIEFSDSNPGVDSSSRLNRDGTTNEGFSDREFDLSTLTITLTEMAHASDDARGDITQNVYGYLGGGGLDTDNWAISYDEIVLYSGTGIYVSRVSGSGSIPGEGRIVAELQALGAYEKLS